MAKVYDGIDPDIAAWIQRQPVFFVLAQLATTERIAALPRREERRTEPPWTGCPA